MLPEDDELYIDKRSWPLLLPLEEVCVPCMFLSTNSSCGTMDESVFPVPLVDERSEADRLADSVEGLAPGSMPVPEAFAALLLRFFVLRKRPPQPLALLIACWCLDS